MELTFNFGEVEIEISDDMIYLEFVRFGLLIEQVQKALCNAATNNEVVGSLVDGAEAPDNQTADLILSEIAVLADWLLRSPLTADRTKRLEIIKNAGSDTSFARP